MKPVATCSASTGTQPRNLRCDSRQLHPEEALLACKRWPRQQGGPGRSSTASGLQAFALSKDRPTREAPCSTRSPRSGGSSGSSLKGFLLAEWDLFEKTPGATGPPVSGRGPNRWMGKTRRGLTLGRSSLFRSLKLYYHSTCVAQTHLSCEQPKEIHLLQQNAELR